MCHRLARLASSWSTAAHSHLNSKIANILTCITSNNKFRERSNWTIKYCPAHEENHHERSGRVSTGDGNCSKSKRKSVRKLGIRWNRSNFSSSIEEVNILLLSCALFFYSRHSLFLFPTSLISSVLPSNSL